jgi:hypothetical protein
VIGERLRSLRLPQANETQVPHTDQPA